ncbi:MAG: hypothetical protein BKP49_07000 [Treponema sp. CETP13]|nr:MAG: hypothetical protein BKP49_07000 [Treponema sp. CETP13]
MKQNNKIVFPIGLILLAFASFFSLGLMLQFLDFGTSTHGFKFACEIVGLLIFSAYGYTSILVPLYLLVGALLCFSPVWTKRKGVYYISSIIPFFTIALVEHLSKSIFSINSSSMIIMGVLTFLLISSLLVAIEYLLIGYFLDQIENKKIANNNKKTPTETSLKDDKMIDLLDDVSEELNIEESSNNSIMLSTHSNDDNNDHNVKEVVSEPSGISEMPNCLDEKFSECSTFVTPEIPEIGEISETPIVVDFDVNKVEMPFKDVSPENFEKKVESNKQTETRLTRAEIEKALDKLEEMTDSLNLSQGEGKKNIEENKDNAEKIETVEDGNDFDLSENIEENEDEDGDEVNLEICEDNDDDLIIEEDIEDIEDSEDLDNLEDSEDLDKLEDSEDLDKLEDIEDKDSDDLGDREDIKDIEDSEDLDNLEDLKEIEDSDVEEELDIGEDLEDYEDITEELDDDIDVNEDNEKDGSLDLADDFVQSILKKARKETGVELSPEKKTELKSSLDNGYKKGYAIPVEGILEEYHGGEYWIIDEKTKQAAVALKDTLKEFKIEAQVTGIRKGPVITMFEILPAPGVKLNKIVALADNIALRLAAQSVRIVAPIPGKHAVGIEIPNENRAIVGFREIISEDLVQYKKMALPVVLGKNINGDAKIIDLAKTPHMLIAGATGSGKSVCVNTMILSLLYNRAPSEVRMILIDPKIVELKLYNDIPHLLTPVITEPKKAFQALQYALCEMERRYALLDGMGVRDIKNYNRRIKDRHIATEKLPYIVIIIDEFADLMATTGKELESTIARLAAMSRAVGIHLVLATQRPSIDVITGLIKANIPSRIAFMVASKTDSRIILDQMGAEKLLGKGDMLYTSSTEPFPSRIQGTFVSDDEVENVVDYVKQFGPPDYIDDEIFMDDEDDESEGLAHINGDEDPLYSEAIEIVMQAGKASASYIQRRLKIGYNRAARLVEQMEDEKIVGPPNGSKPREILRTV